MILQKKQIFPSLQNGFYRSTIEVIDDMNIMFENAKKYNRPDSKIFKVCWPLSISQNTF